MIRSPLHGIPSRCCHHWHVRIGIEFLEIFYWDFVLIGWNQAMVGLVVVGAQNLQGEKTMRDAMDWYSQLLVGTCSQG